MDPFRVIPPGLTKCFVPLLLTFTIDLQKVEIPVLPIGAGVSATNVPSISCKVKIIAVLSIFSPVMATPEFISLCVTFEQKDFFVPVSIQVDGGNNHIAFLVVIHPHFGPLGRRNLFFPDCIPILIGFHDVSFRFQGNKNKTTLRGPFITSGN